MNIYIAIRSGSPSQAKGGFRIWIDGVEQLDCTDLAEWRNPHRLELKCTGRPLEIILITPDDTFQTEYITNVEDSAGPQP